MVELRKARATDTPVCECRICCLGVSEWLYKMVTVRSQCCMCGGFPQGFPPGCTECSCARTRGERLVSIRVYLGIGTVSDRLHLQLRDSTSLTYTYAACRRPLRLIPRLSVRRSTGSTRPEDSTNFRSFRSFRSYCFGALVLWCFGALVLWCFGALGALGSSSSHHRRTLELQCYFHLFGALVLWCFRSFRSWGSPT